MLEDRMLEEELKMIEKLVQIAAVEEDQAMEQKYSFDSKEPTVEDFYGRNLSYSRKNNLFSKPKNGRHRKTNT